ncbi:MAG: hypothetical protein JWO94_1447 [Verrucomicrobiaceae bacterium]|nr:hypothetical protein [Verrucomicrobiaceae bacterium]
MRALDRWLLPYLRQAGQARPPVKHVFVAIADHFEPFHKTDRAGALERMRRWRDLYPAAVADFRDSEGRGPRHSFFYPVEQYDEEVVGHVAALCRETGGEVEMHLHHENDTEATLRTKLATGAQHLAAHGLLSRHPDGRPAFAFVHGDWALANSGPGGQCCGVPHEIQVLLEEGCYADFTFPSAPDPSQPRRINSLYYVRDTGLPTALDAGAPVRFGIAGPANHLLLVQGVVALNWKRRKWGLVPRVENSDLTEFNPPTKERFDLWLRHAPRIAGLEEWAFVKLHSHGATPANSKVFLGAPMRNFHHYLCEEWAAQPDHILHYVTAREMANVLHAVEAGQREFNPAMLTHRYPPPASSL